jgi:hypothetical protein
MGLEGRGAVMGTKGGAEGHREGKRAELVLGTRGVI